MHTEEEAGGIPQQEGQGERRGEGTPIAGQPFRPAFCYRKFFAFVPLQSQFRLLCSWTGHLTIMLDTRCPFRIRNQEPYKVTMPKYITVQILLWLGAIFSSFQFSNNGYGSDLGGGALLAHKADESMRLSVKIDNGNALEVGRQLKINITLENISKQAFSIPIEMKNDNAIIPIHYMLEYQYVGETRPSEVIGYGTFHGTTRKTMAYQLIEIKPNEKVDCQVCLTTIAPGEGNIHVSYTSNIKPGEIPIYDKTNPRGVSIKKITNAWSGDLEINLPVKIIMGEGLKFDKRIESLRRQEIVDVEKMAALQFSSDERNPHVVRFLLEEIKKMKEASPLKFVCVQSLVEMAREGYGYEGIGELLEIMNNENEMENTRLLAMDILPTLVGKDRISIKTKHSMGYYEISKALKNETMKTLEMLRENERESIREKADGILEKEVGSPGDLPVPKPNADQKTDNASGNMKESKGNDSKARASEGSEAHDPLSPKGR
ncbi:MAG: hypothetical protein AAB215_07995 [Planctomycetota bacterium]